MRFTKMHGIGNDFIVLDSDARIEDIGALARRLCCRRTGIGADGLLVVGPGEAAEVRMRVINSDGSEAEMCGNGVRCAAKYAYDSGVCRKSEFGVETLAGVKHIRLQIENGRAVAATVDMGEPDFDPARFPVLADSNRIRVDLDGRKIDFFCVNTGVPHAVTFDLLPDEEDFLRFGAYMEAHPLFPQKANIEFCRADSPEKATVKVWERGCGPTLACGTGSCAVLVAGVELGLLKRCADIHLPGGVLRDEWAGNKHIFMTGPAETVFTGEF